MRALGLVACGLLLTACVNRAEPVARPASSAPLTAAAALGELRTVDFCSLLDERGADSLSSFELCRTEVDFVELTVGPLVAGPSVGSEPYEYPGDLPPGLRVWSYFPSGGPNGCVLWLGFADGVWLTVTALDAADPPWSAADSYCRTAATVVAGALAAIEEGRVGHVSHEPDSFGGIDPCPLITGPELGGVPTAAPSGHSCVNGDVELSFGIDVRASGTQETIGGQEATVRRDRKTCAVVFQRPVDEDPRYVAQARVTVTGDDEQACVFARDVAELVAPRLPQ
jgi:hypothetical protein